MAGAVGVPATANVGADPTGCTATTSAVASTASSHQPRLNGWSVDRVLELTGADNGADLLITGENRAAIVHSSGRRTWVSRTTDGGAEWSVPAPLTPSGRRVSWVAASASGPHIDVISQVGGPAAELYRHSSNGGATWGPTRSMSPLGGLPDIARGPGGLVAEIALGDPLTYRVRVSENGGVSFRTPVRVGRLHGCGDVLAGPAIAIAGDAIVVAFRDVDAHLVSRRSIDAGRTWSSPKVLSMLGQYWVLDLAVRGDDILALFDRNEAGDVRLLSRLSENGGRTWRAPTLFGVDVTGAAAGYGGGRWRLISADSEGTGRYRSSADGENWTAPIVIYVGAEFLAPPIGVGTPGGSPAGAYLDQDIFFLAD